MASGWGFWRKNNSFSGLLLGYQVTAIMVAGKALAGGQSQKEKKEVEEGSFQFYLQLWDKSWDSPKEQHSSQI